tara:strand:- start:174 stop:2099 length:1926 start_codon:yes stop_codon:yes gene_type:complete
MGGGGGGKGGKKGKKRKSLRTNVGDDGAGSAYSQSPAQRQFKQRVSEGKSGFTGSSRKNPDGTFFTLKQERAYQAQQAKAKAEAAAAAKKAEETRKRTFDPNRLYSGSSDASAFTGPGLGINDSGKFSSSRVNTKTRYSNKDYLTATPYKEAFRRTFFGDGLQGNRFNPVDRAAALGAGYTDSLIGATNFAKNRLVPFGNKLPNIPTLPKFQDSNLQGLRNFGSVAIPGLQTFGAAQRLSKVGLGQEISQMTTSNANFNAGVRPQLTKTGISDVNPLTIAKAFTPQMVATGPTAGASSALLGTTTALQAGGLNLGTTEAGDKSEGGAASEEGRNTRSLKSKALGVLDSFTSDAFDFDGLGKSRMPDSMRGAVDIAGAFQQGAIGQTKDAYNAVMGLNQRATPGDTVAINKEMQNLTQNLGNPDSPFAPINRGLKAFFTDDPTRKGFAEFGKDVRDTFTPGAPGRSPREIGGEGSTFVEKIGKGIIGRDLTNIVTEGDKSAGIEAGSTRNIGDLISLGQQINKNIKDPLSISGKAALNIAKLTGQGTQAPTIRTILTPRGGGSRPSPGAAAPGSGSGEIPVIQPIPVSPPTADPDLRSITEEAYQKRLAQLRQLTPLPPVVQPTRSAPRINFRNAFNRDYFA